MAPDDLPPLQLISHEEAEKMMTRGAPGSPGTPEQAHNAGRRLLRADMTPVSHITPANASATPTSEPVRGEQEQY